MAGVAAMALGASPAWAAGRLAPTGQVVTPTAAPGASFRQLNPGLKDFPTFTAGQLVATSVSPDGKTLLVLSSGFNRNYDTQGKLLPADSNEYVFVFDISRDVAVQTQALQVPNSFDGIAFTPDGGSFVVSGGREDTVYTFSRSGTDWTEAGPALALGHNATNGLTPGGTTPIAAGIGVTADGKTVVVANYENDSITILDRASEANRELDLRPGKGVAGGEFPFGVVVKGNDLAYVSSVRDREIVAVRLGATPKVVARIAVGGNPNRMILNRAGTLLYAAVDNSDEVVVVDTATNRIVQRVKVAAPADLFAGPVPPGADPNSLALSPDERTLYVTDGGINAVSVIDLAGAPRVRGLIPTGWYPNSVSVSADGRTLYVVNGEGDGGANPGNCRPAHLDLAKGCPAPLQHRAANQYIMQRDKGGLLTLPVPDAATLRTLTRQVAANDGFNLKLTGAEQRVIRQLHARIRHVIYIVKENRTYDQVLGDLPVGNGDPGLAQFPQAVTPNEHAIALQFVTLDNFRDSANVSYDGWQWSTAGRTVDATEKTYPVYYADRGASYDSEGDERNVNVGYASTAERRAANPATPADPDLLPGTANEEDIDGPHGEKGRGYLWDAALRAGLSLRNYGFHCDLSRYFAKPGSANYIPPLEDPFAGKTRVAFPAHPALMAYTDPYYRGFDDNLPDYYRYKEWAREFDLFVAHHDLPNLTLLRLPDDHTGAFGSAIRGVDTPELQVADNDYALGLVLDKVAHSPYAKDTLVFVVEDDAQDGPDHVDAHRSIAFVAGPYVRQHAVVSLPYTTVSVIRTMEAILGLPTQSLHDAGVRPMVEIFDMAQKDWTYRATPSAYLRGTRLPLPPAGQTHAAIPRPLHDAAWWAARTRRFSFVAEDLNDPTVYNRVLWRGTMGPRPYPTVRSGRDLRGDRAALLKLER